MTKTPDAPKPRSDGSRRFTLKGGRWQGMKVRLYPDYVRSPGNVKQPVWDDFTLDADVYEHPPVGQQHPTKPFLILKAT